MSKIFLLEIWEILKREKKILILSVFAFTFACIAINITLVNLESFVETEKNVKENYGNKCYYKLYLPGESDVYCRVFSEGYLLKRKAAFDELKTEKSFRYRYSIEDQIDFFCINEEKDGEQTLPKYRKECLAGYEEGLWSERDDYVALKAFYVDSFFPQEPNITLSSGTWFQKEDYTILDPSGLNVPVVLGNSYKEDYSIGDCFFHAHLGTEDSVTLKVIGFLQKGSYLLDNNNEKKILDRYLVVPSLEMAYTEEKNTLFEPFFKACYDSQKLINTRVICEKENEDSVIKKVNSILQKNDLYEFRLVSENAGIETFLASCKRELLASLFITFFIILLLLTIFCIQMCYRIIRNKKKYSVFILNGITKPQIFFALSEEPLLIFILSFLLYGIIFFLFAGNNGIPISFNNWSFVIIGFMELIIILFLGFIGIKKVHNADLCSALRERE